MACENQKIAAFFLFEGNAEEAMNFYTELFDDAKIVHLVRYGRNEGGEEGKVMRGAFSLKGQLFMCTDSNIKHDFTFTPSVSLFVTCETEEEIDRLFAGLSEGGQVLMPLAQYPFSPKFAWVQDRFGLSWQLSLETGDAGA